MAISDKEKVKMLEVAFDQILDDLKDISLYVKHVEEMAMQVSTHVDCSTGSEANQDQKSIDMICLKNIISERPTSLEIYAPKK
jgi:hypothetical protein